MKMGQAHTSGLKIADCGMAYAPCFACQGFVYLEFDGPKCVNCGRVQTLNQAHPGVQPTPSAKKAPSPQPKPSYKGKARPMAGKPDTRSDSLPPAKSSSSNGGKANQKKPSLEVDPLDEPLALIDDGITQLQTEYSQRAEELQIVKEQLDTLVSAKQVLRKLNPHRLTCDEV